MPQDRIGYEGLLLDQTLGRIARARERKRVEDANEILTRYEHAEEARSNPNSPVLDEAFNNELRARGVINAATDPRVEANYTSNEATRELDELFSDRPGAVNPFLNEVTAIKNKGAFTRVTPMIGDMLLNGGTPEQRAEEIRSYGPEGVNTILHVMKQVGAFTSDMREPQAAQPWRAVNVQVTMPDGTAGKQLVMVNQETSASFRIPGLIAPDTSAGSSPFRAITENVTMEGGKAGERSAVLNQRTGDITGRGEVVPKFAPPPLQLKTAPVAGPEDERRKESVVFDPAVGSATAIPGRNVTDEPLSLSGGVDTEGGFTFDVGTERNAESRARAKQKEAFQINVTTSRKMLFAMSDLVEKIDNGSDLLGAVANAASELNSAIHQAKAAGRLTLDLTGINVERALSSARIPGHVRSQIIDSQVIRSAYLNLAYMYALTFKARPTDKDVERALKILGESGDRLQARQLLLGIAQSVKRNLMSESVDVFKRDDGSPREPFNIVNELDPHMQEILFPLAHKKAQDNAVRDNPGNPRKVYDPKSGLSDRVIRIEEVPR